MFYVFSPLGWRWLVLNDGYFGTKPVKLMFAARIVTIDYAWTPDMRHTYLNILVQICSCGCLSRPYCITCFCFFFLAYMTILSLIPSISMLSSRHSWNLPLNFRNLQHLPPDPLGRLNTLTRSVSYESYVSCHGYLAIRVFFLKTICFLGRETSKNQSVLLRMFLFSQLLGMLFGLFWVK